MAGEFERFGEGEVPQSQKQTDVDRSGLSQKEREVQEKMDVLKRQLDTVQSQKKVTGSATNRLETGLKGDPTIKDDPDARPTIELYRMYKGRYDEALQQEGDLMGKLQKLESEIDHSLQQMNQTGTLSQEPSVPEVPNASQEVQPGNPRPYPLNEVTKEHVDPAGIVSGKVREVEFSIPQENAQSGKTLPPASDAFPKEVRAVEVEGKLYVRRGLSSDFFHGNEALDLKHGTKATISKLAEAGEIEKMQGENKEKFDQFVTKHPEIKIDEITTHTLQEAINDGIEDEGELAFILSGNPSKISKTSPESIEKMGKVTQRLEKAGLMDDSRSNSGGLVQKIAEILQTLSTHGQGMSYQVGANGDINFGLGANGLPEGIDNLDTFSKFQKIALSQIGTNEGNGSADRYFEGFPKGLSSKTTPRCAAFVNWCLKQAGYEGSNSLAAKSFIKESGMGHVGIKMGDKLLGGNQGDKVCLAHLGKNPVGYAIPTDGGLKVVKPAGDVSAIPDGSIVVYSRSVSNKQQA